MVSPDPEFIMPIGIYNGGRQKPIAVINGTEYDLTEHDLILSIREY